MKGVRAMPTSGQQTVYAGGSSTFREFDPNAQARLNANTQKQQMLGRWQPGQPFRGGRLNGQNPQGVQNRLGAVLGGTQLPQASVFTPAQPRAMGPRPISAPFGTPEFYQQLGQQNAAITGDPTWAKMGTAAQMAPQSRAEVAQNLSVRDPGAWRARVTALTGQDPVAPGVQWAAANPSRDPRAALAQALMQRGGNLRAGFGPGRFRLNRV